MVHETIKWNLIYHVKEFGHIGALQEDADVDAEVKNVNCISQMKKTITVLLSTLLNFVVRFSFKEGCY